MYPNAVMSEFFSLKTEELFFIVFFIAFLIASFIFSFFVRKAIFQELDYFEIKYTSITKKRALWVIYFNLIIFILWIRILWRLADLAF